MHSKNDSKRRFQENFTGDEIEIFNDTCKQEARARWRAHQEKYKAFEAYYMKFVSAEQKLEECTGQYISHEEWGDQWEWAFLPSPYSLDSERRENQNGSRG